MHWCERRIADSRCGASPLLTLAKPAKADFRGQVEVTPGQEPLSHPAIFQRLGWTALTRPAGGCACGHVSAWPTAARAGVLQASCAGSLGLSALLRLLPGPG
jgi:hypothetical protein